ncbi:hypothetical protein MATL_G00031980 [Megalops atlanticus]|uniref:Septin-type G domain-containing protein n=1 Tax=Megalops atlanticus TaxID=7932 RepID=A0A9D3TCD0_MEGAT|nr:hypothetical protein MATL_G00031980 [Megalops atlanticus]
MRSTLSHCPHHALAINSFNTVISYSDDQFKHYLHDESGLNQGHIVDNRVHCCYYFISPLGHSLKPMDVQIMKAVHNKVSVVPVITKADILTLREPERFKRRWRYGCVDSLIAPVTSRAFRPRRSHHSVALPLSHVLDEIEEHGIKIYHLPNAESDEDKDLKGQTRILKASVPFVVVGSNQQIEANGEEVCLSRMHMQDLQEVTQDLHYENFHSKCLKQDGRLSSHGYILPLSPV